MENTSDNSYSDELFKSVFNYAAIGMALVSTSGRWLKVNKAVCDIVGYTEDELLKIDFQTITHPDDLESDLSLLHQLIDRKIDSYQMEKRYFHKDGHIVWIILSVSLIRNNDGSPKFFISQIQDITERKQKEEQLNLVISSTMDGYWDWYIKDDYEYMSPRFWEIFGFEAHEKKNHPSEWQKLIFEEDLQTTLKNFNLHISTKGKHPFYQEIRYRHKNGSTVWVICKGRVVEWSSTGEPIRMVGIHTDITNLKKMQEELEVQREKQNHSSRLASLGQMAGGIAHEINNPLAILSGHSNMLITCSEQVDIDKKIVKASAKSIRETVLRMATIIKGLKNFARDSSKDDFEEFDLKQLVDEVIALCEDRYKRHEVSVEISDSIDGVKLFGQKVQIGQVLINLFNNAFDAVKVLETKWVKLNYEADAKNSKIIIEDSGGGLSEEIRSKLMEPFFTTKKSGEGTGIGLSICKNIMEKHFGELYIDDNAKNTRFVITMPKFNSL